MSNQGTATGATDGTADDAGSAGGLNQFISFAIGDDQYGVDIMAVREIKGWSQINPLPGQPDYMRGVLIFAAPWSRSWTCAAASEWVRPRQRRFTS